MRRWTPSQLDLFETRLPCELPIPQRSIAVELLKVLLADVMSAGEAACDGLDDQGIGDDQDHA